MLTNKNLLITKFAVILFYILITFSSFACHFPSIYINHYAFPVKTSVDGGSSTWFNPLISGQYDGCYLGISDVHNFTLAAGQEHGVELFQYYAAVGVSNQTCQNYDIYGSASPLTNRYKTLCQASQATNCPNANNPCCQSPYPDSCDPRAGSAPGICIVYEDILISWAFSNCVNNMTFSNKLNCMDQPNPSSCPAAAVIPNIDSCASNASAGIAGCFPYPLPPSPPPFCDQIPITPQTAVYLPICSADSSNSGVCGTSIIGLSTYMDSCARVTFNNYIEYNQGASTQNSLMPICTNGNTWPSCVEIANPPLTPSNITPPYAQIDPTAYANIISAGHVETIYTATLGSGTTQTRWDSSTQQTPLIFYGYNLAPFQDLCYNFRTNQNSSVSMTDNYGASRSFRTCLPPPCTGTGPAPNYQQLPIGCTSETNSTYCIEETTGTTPSSQTCGPNPYCFNRPSMEVPKVELCSGSRAINTPTSYCLQLISDLGDYTFTSSNLSQSIFTAVQTDNNYSLPNGTSSLCMPYYDPSNNPYGTNGGNTGNCQYYAGLYYDSNSTYQSGATKFCLNGYQPTDQQDIVCNSSSNSTSMQISDRSVPAANQPSPLAGDQCCNPLVNTGQINNPCPQSTVTPPTSTANTPFRSKNPIELGLCVDIMPFTLQTCNFQPSKTLTQAQATQLNNDCNTYTTFCTTPNSMNTGYTNSDICNKNFIDCSINPKISPPNQPSGIISNVCQFYAPNQ